MGRWEGSQGGGGGNLQQTPRSAWSLRQGSISDPQIMTWAEIKSVTPNWATQAPLPIIILNSVHQSEEMGSDVILQIFNPKKDLRFEYDLYGWKANLIYHSEL